MSIADYIKSADWKAEKHAPVIELPETIHANTRFMVTVSVGKEIPHPNTTEHHIRWIEVYFYPEGDKFIYHVGRFDFTAHGEAVAGANQGPVYTEPIATFAMKVAKPGKLVAMAYCNIHGLWQSEAEIVLSE